jgi:tripartite-type tricarboxylate transporter receptor subunit TctC
MRDRGSIKIIRETGVKRRQLLQAAALAMVAPASRAQGKWPQSAIRLIVPFTPGGGTDTVSRLVAQNLTVMKGWSIVVDNRPGAAGNIGLEAVSKAAPDGYILGMGQTSNLTINPALYEKMLFDPLKDLTPIVQVCSQPVVLVVRNESPVHTLADFIAAAKGKKLTVAQAGMGTVGHLAGEMFARSAQVDVLQVPYKGAGPAMNDLLGGQIDAYFGSAASVMPMIKADKMRPLAITSEQRLPALPTVPTVAEQGYPGFEVSTWLGLVGPARLPVTIVAEINAAVLEMLGRKEVQDRLIAEGNVPIGGTPQAFSKYIHAEHAKWGKLIREAHIKLQ